jgi:hypothetical protein
MDCTSASAQVLECFIALSEFVPRELVRTIKYAICADNSSHVALECLMAHLGHWNSVSVRESRSGSIAPSTCGVFFQQAASLRV